MKIVFREHDGPKFGDPIATWEGSSAPSTGDLVTLEPETEKCYKVSVVLWQGPFWVTLFVEELITP